MTPVAPLRTVLADDVEEMRDLLRMLLTRDGRFIIVGEAADGARAVEVVEKEQPNLVVLDVRMPLVDGMEALPRMRRLSPNTRVVMFSAFSSDEMAQPARDLGAVGYIEKQGDSSHLPSQIYALATVLETVQRVLDATYAATPASARQARSDLRDVLEAKVAENTLDVVELLTTELVINSVEHTGTRATVIAEVHRDKVRVAVSDEGPGVPARRAASAAEETGRGLLIVDSLAQNWGVDRQPRGKTVWFEVGVGR
ncbi:MAG TPA: response regulator [Acidimicrobiales bacterium]|nr:response regulator [Acidimicrobiales bacterium]